MPSDGAGYAILSPGILYILPILAILSFAVVFVGVVEVVRRGWASAAGLG